MCSYDGAYIWILMASYVFVHMNELCSISHVSQGSCLGVTYGCFVREDINGKKTFSFGQLGPFFSDVKIQVLKVT